VSSLPILADAFLYPSLPTAIVHLLATQVLLGFLPKSYNPPQKMASNKMCWKVVVQCGGGGKCENAETEIHLCLLCSNEITPRLGYSKSAARMKI